MPIDHIILDSSPIICLHKSGLSDLLPQIFENIVVPDVVKDEVMVKGATDFGLEKFFTNKWLKQIDNISIHPDIAAWGLGKGECSVISYALLNHTCWAIIDDREARRCAESVGCFYTGTIGIIVLAKKRKIIPSARKAMNNLQDAGLWLSTSFIENVCKKLGE